MLESSHSRPSFFCTMCFFLIAMIFVLSRRLQVLHFVFIYVSVRTSSFAFVVPADSLILFEDTFEVS